MVNALTYFADVYDREKLSSVERGSRFEFNCNLSSVSLSFSLIEFESRTKAETYQELKRHASVVDDFKGPVAVGVVVAHKPRFNHRLLVIFFSRSHRVSFLETAHHGNSTVYLWR
jgi:hypothetical protein